MVCVLLTNDRTVMVFPSEREACAGFASWGDKPLRAEPRAAAGSEANVVGGAPVKGGARPQ